MGKYKFTIISLVIILVAAIPLLLLSNKNSSKLSQAMLHVSPTPTLAPFTSQNADTSLEQADSLLQNTLDQTDTDLSVAAQVDASQDNTTGL